MAAPRRMIAIAAAACLLAAVPALCEDVVSVTTSAPSDSVTVGQRFRVVHTFSFPDSVEMVPATTIDVGTCRLLAANWEGGSEAGRRTRAVSLELIALDLEAARLPATTFDFVTPGGDTLRTSTQPVEVPVRLVAGEGDDLEPLKAQWEAPHRRWLWVVGAAVLLALAALGAVLWMRRRRKEEEAPVPTLPADYVALGELARIERMGLLEDGQWKRYYTLVVDVVRRYLDDRFGVDAMDRTSWELLSELERRRIHIDPLAGLMGEADLVKFARFEPTREAGERAMRAAREVVVQTTPKTAPAETQERAAANGGGG